MDDIKIAIGFFFHLILGIVIGFVTGTNMEFERSQKEIMKINQELVERDLKCYNPKTGELVWKEEK
jgi:hypothetical protein